MKKFCISIFAFWCTLISSGQAPLQKEVNSRLKNLPFNSFSVTVPVFPEQTFNIKDEGAIGDGLFKNTEIINETIRKCADAGGGTVTIPAGLWLTGPITMKSHVNLHLEEGALVSFSSDLDDYKLIKSGTKYNIPSLINGEKLVDVAITGDGIFNGTGEAWRPVKKEKMSEGAWKKLLKSGGSLTANGKIWYPREGAVAAEDFLKTKKSFEMTYEDYQKAKPYFRPYMLNLEDSKNVLIQGITLQNSPKFCMILRDIDGLVVKDVKALNDWWAQNGDGLDLSGCKHVLMYNCTVNTGDDGICLKSSGRGKNEFRLENIVIQDCKVFHAHGGFVIGSNTDGKMRNIYVNNCSFSWTDTGLRFKSGAGRGGRVENIFVDGIYMKGIEHEAIIFDLTYEDSGAVKMKDSSVSNSKLPDFDGFSFKNIFVEGAETACRMDGFPLCHVKNVTFENMVIRSEKGFLVSCGENISLDDVLVKTKKKPSYALKDTRNFIFKNMNAPEPGDPIIIEGKGTGRIEFVNSLITKENIRLEDGLSSTILFFIQEGQK